MKRRRVVIMNVFNKIKEAFSNGSHNRRVSGVERTESRVTRNIEFTTSVGGSLPLDFITKSEASENMEKEPIALLKKAIEAGCIDKDSDLSIFYDIVNQYEAKAENGFEEQAIDRKRIGHEIQRNAKQHYLVRLRKQSQLAGERDMIPGITQYRKFSFDKQYQERIGD